MASLSCDKSGKRTIQFVGSDKRRRTLRLGNVNIRLAEVVRRHVEELNVAKIMSQPVAPATASWVASLDRSMYDRLVNVNLLAAKAETVAMSLGPFLQAYVAERRDVKPATKEVWAQVVRNLCDFWGEDRELSTVLEADADSFKQYLVDAGLAPTTIQKRLQFARMFFKAAVRRKLIAENPFAEVSGRAVLRQDRHRYVTREEIDRILACCDANWQAIVGLARYGGLRCPSEVLSVKWTDIDWQTSRLVVTSPKTAHHEGKGNRVIPLFPELRPILLAAQEAATAGAEYVVSGYREAALTDKGWKNCNLRTQFERILKRAGIVSWPRLFHALRASRETELARDYPLHVVTAWLGNTPKIALKHYLMVTDADYERAAESAAATCGETQQSEEIDDRASDETAVFSDDCNDLLLAAASLSGGQGIRTLNRFPGT